MLKRPTWKLNKATLPQFFHVVLNGYLFCLSAAFRPSVLQTNVIMCVMFLNWLLV